MKITNLFSKINRHSKGVAIAHHKNTAQIPSKTLPVPEKVIIPMQQHIGAPCVPIVQIREHVKVGQVIAKSDSAFSADIHASISGNVTKIETIKMPNGVDTLAIVIESDSKMDLFEGLCPHDIKNREDLIKAAKDCGLVGLGGAGFPTHIKLNPPKDKPIDTLIINAAECEPYITSDNRTIFDHTDDIISGISIIKKYLNIESAVIAIEDNKPEAIKRLKSSIKAQKSPISVHSLWSRYPQGAEKVIIKSCTGRKVPIGKLPSDVGCIVMNVSSVYALYNYIKTGMPLVSRLITVEGSAIKNPQNVLVPIGTPIKDLIEFCGGYRCPAKKILMGGPMMGIAVVSDSMPILKQNNAILILDSADTSLLKESNCIRCGKCIRSCPMHLTPLFFEQSVRENDTDALEKLKINNCMECGSCAFSCPAHRPLVQSIQLGKNLVKKNKTPAGGNK